LLSDVVTSSRSCFSSSCLKRHRQEDLRFCSRFLISSGGIPCRINRLLIVSRKSIRRQRTASGDFYRTRQVPHPCLPKVWHLRLRLHLDVPSFPHVLQLAFSNSISPTIKNSRFSIGHHPPLYPFQRGNFGGLQEYNQRQQS